MANRQMTKRGSFPRMDRVSNEVQRVLAFAMEKHYEPIDSESIATVTAVVVDPDLRRAKVYFDHLSPRLEDWLSTNRVKLQREIANGVRMRSTPLLFFEADPAIASGLAIESILRKVIPPNVMDVPGGDE